MTIVEGQIETLKKLKESLNRSGITRFGSIGEIRLFLKNFESEREHLPSRARSEVETEIHGMQKDLDEHQQAYYRLKADVRSELEQEINEVESELTRVTEESNRNKFYKTINYLKTKSLSRRVAHLKGNLEKNLNKKVRDTEKTIATLEKNVERSIENKEFLITKRLEDSLAVLTNTKAVLDDLYTLVAGAIGENAVANTLQELSDDYYLINDFSVRFDRPIYNRKEDDRIYSIQVDHLLVSKAGIFLLETKNWSKASVESLDLRSPVEQIRRTSFALFVLLHSESRHSDIGLERHHWGDKKIPIRNIIVMINEKPKVEFKHVKVLSLNELIGYIQYFDQTFSGDEVNSIFEYLKRRM